MISKSQSRWRAAISRVSLQRISTGPRRSLLDILINQYSLLTQTVAAHPITRRRRAFSKNRSTTLKYSNRLSWVWKVTSLLLAMNKPNMLIPIVCMRTQAAPTTRAIKPVTVITRRLRHATSSTSSRKSSHWMSQQSTAAALFWTALPRSRVSPTLQPTWTHFHLKKIIVLEREGVVISNRKSSQRTLSQVAMEAVATRLYTRGRAALSKPKWHHNTRQIRNTPIRHLPRSSLGTQAPRAALSVVVTLWRSTSKSTENSLIQPLTPKQSNCTMVISTLSRPRTINLRILAVAPHQYRWISYLLAQKINLW